MAAGIAADLYAACMDCQWPCRMQRFLGFTFPARSKAEVSSAPLNDTIANGLNRCEPAAFGPMIDLQAAAGLLSRRVADRMTSRLGGNNDPDTVLAGQR